MRGVLVQFVLLVAGINFLCAQTTIKEVDEAVKKILNSKKESLEKKELFISGEGEMLAWLENEEPRIIEVIQKDSVQKTVTWYFQDQALLYSHTIWLDRHSNKKLYEEKTYHQHGVLFAWLNSENKFRDANSPEFKNLDRRLQSYSQELLARARE